MKPKVRKILEGRGMKIYRVFERELKSYGPKRINFNDVAREVGCSPRTVSRYYHMMKDEDIVGVDNEKMLLPSMRQKKAT